MHAVVSKVTINDRDAADSHLRENVVPGVSQARIRSSVLDTKRGTTRMAMVVFESEDTAKAMSRVPSMVPDVVTLEDIEVREVVAHA